MLIKEITFYFENCDYFTIDGKYIGKFLVSDIHKEIIRLACNAIDEINVVHNFAIEISSMADDDYFVFEQAEWVKNKFKRLTENDITHIEFILYNQYSDKIPIKKYYYSVVWTGNSEYTNAAQQTYISTLGNLYIAISDNKTIDDFFDKEFINDKCSMDFAFDMYEVPYK